MFVHLVYFWLKDGAGDGQRRALAEDCRAMLGGIETVQHLWAGRPAMTPREIVDNSYDVGLCVVYEDAKGHDVYQQHPRHLEFIAKHMASWKRVQVYDFVEE